MTNDQSNLTHFVKDEGLVPFLEQVPQTIVSAYEACWTNSAMASATIHRDAFLRGIQWHVDDAILSLAKRVGIRALSRPNKIHNCHHAEVCSKTSRMVFSRVPSESETPRHAEYRSDILSPNDPTLFDFPGVEIKQGVGLLVVHGCTGRVRLRPDFVKLIYKVPDTLKAIVSLDLFALAKQPLTVTIPEEQIEENFKLVLKEEEFALGIA